MWIWLYQVLSSLMYLKQSTVFDFYRFVNIKKKKVREKSRECHNHKPQPFPDTKRKRKQTKPNKRKSNKRTKSTKISSLFLKTSTCFTRLGSMNCAEICSFVMPPPLAWCQGYLASAYVRTLFHTFVRSWSFYNQVKIFKRCISGFLSLQQLEFGMRIYV